MPGVHAGMTARDDLARVLDDAECPDCGHHAFYHHPMGSCSLTTYGTPEDGFQPAEPCRCDTPFGDSLADAVIREWLPTEGRLAYALYLSTDLNLPLADPLDIDCHDAARAALRALRGDA